MPASEFLTTQTMGGYIVVLAIAGGLTYYYMADKNKAQVSKGAKPYVEPRKDNNAKKQRQAAFASTAQKAPVEDTASSSAVAPASTTWLSNDPKEDADNKEFAKRMTSVKEGKKFDGKSTGDQKKKQKSVKQSRAAEKDAEQKPVEVAEEKAPAPAPAPAPAVEAEAEAEEEEEEEEEESPAASPEVAPADPSGVSDMLEPSAAGPSVLRLTGTDKEKPKAKSQKAPEKAETKKQRQNRQKNEAKKAAREEDEKERKVKLEKQRRTAREAAGIPAKDGSQFMASVNGKQSAWAAGSPNDDSAAVQPLDTFEAPAKNGTAATTAAPAQASESWISSLPSEEEQMERLKDDADEWNTVKTKASKKTKKEVQAPSPEPAAAPAAPVESRPIAQAVQKPAASNGKAAKPAQSYGSFSALSTDEKEEEWDV